MAENVDREADGATGASVIGAVLGVVAVIAALIPGLFLFAWLFGLIAIVAGRPAFRRTRSMPGHTTASVAVFAGVLALVLGVVNLGIVLDWFTYFTVEDAFGRGRASLR